MTRWRRLAGVENAGSANYVVAKHACYPAIGRVASHAVLTVNLLYTVTAISVVVYINNTCLARGVEREYLTCVLILVKHTVSWCERYHNSTCYHIVTMAWPYTYV